VKGGAAAKGKKGGKSKGDTGAGAGAGSALAKEGALHLVTYHEVPSRGGPTSYELRKVAFGCSSNAWIADVKFSPLGGILAAGSHDKHMYVYRLGDFFVLLFRSDSGHILIDWKC
jgi:hypothetical protein